MGVCLAVCSVTVAAPAQSPIIDSLHVLIPGGAGGGWDRTARSVGQALSDTGLVDGIRYENLSGGGGGKAIAHLIELDQPDMLMVNSTPIIVRSLQGIFPQSFRDLVPVASVIGDYSVFAVRTQSDIASLEEFARRQQAQPRRIAIGGGSVPGGTDHIVAAMLVKGLGGDPRGAKYIPYDAGGKAMAGLLSGEVQLLSSGFGEVVDMMQQGWIRLMCVAASQRLAAAPDTPTCEEAGATGVTFVNWRGFFAPPSVSAARVAQYHRVLEDMLRSSQWATIRDRNGWVDSYHAGDDFVTMLEQQEQVVGDLMHQLGLL